ncbi:MAG: TonB-dependent receptor [Paludibacter sp.]|nr:TonB-dependent receptor [Paludibacter sp.]
MPVISLHQFRFFRVQSLLWLLFLPSMLVAENDLPADSTKTHTIREVTVTEKYLTSEVRSTTPLQILNSKSIEGLNVLQVSDAVKYFSGVTVKDYGGIGGLKTISVRSLGGNHTGVSYDGITLTDCQTGQIDLGRFSLDNVDMISLNSGQSDNIFQPARLFASASILNIRTLSPEFTGNKLINGKVSMKAGSFGLLNPSLWLEGKLNPKLSASLSGEWLSADGKYPYVLHYGNSAKDLTTNEIRQNTDVHNLRLEGALYATFSDHENGYLKSYYYQSERGLPGPTILYNPENSSKQRISDNTFFTQAHYEKEFSRFLAFQANAKYNSGYMHYVDPTFLNIDGKQESTYLQTEYYGSASVLYRALNNLSFSASTDGAVSTLTSDASGFAYPTRYSWLSVLAGKYVTNQVLATASVLSTLVHETVKNGKPAVESSKLSPSVSLSVKPFADQDIRVRVFYKNIFRLPSFNDLYYSQVGNRDLKPEKANQYNLGLTYNLSISTWLPLLKLTIDGYHNDVTDKIVAYPNKDTFSWTVMNFGKVAIDGLDLTAETTLQPCKKIGILLGTNYTYQRALNVTNPTDGDYNNQLPYTPRVSGSGKAGIETPWVNISYSLLWSGHRYAVKQNYSENRLPAYFDHSISINRSIQLKNQLVHINLEVLNLLDSNYEIVKWFPMPGRSFRATVSLKF